MYLLSKAYGHEWREAQFAVIEIDPASAAMILKRIEVVMKMEKKDDSVACIHYYDWRATWLKTFEDDDNIDDELGGEDFVELSFLNDGWDEYAIRTECERMVVHHDCVYWSAYPKHADYKIESAMMSKEVLEKIAASCVGGGK